MIKQPDFIVDDKHVIETRSRTDESGSKLLAEYAKKLTEPDESEK